jgi:pimeloyl-ACP methyl ester carboxylesterase
MREHRVASEGAVLAAREQGPADGPAVLLVHGFPDTQAVWSPLASRLAERHHVVSYDLRGAGASSDPSGPRPYALERLAGDARAVIDALAGGRPVHLVGHDWGAIQGWEFLYAPTTAPRIASFTSISGACFDHFGLLARERLRHPRGGSLLGTLDQLRRSWYMLALQPPGAFELAWRHVLAPRWSELLARREGVPPADDFPAPTLARDGANLVRLYRGTPLARLLAPRRREPVSVPVQVISPERDRFLSPATARGIERFAPRLTVRTVPGGHWAPRTHPEPLAELIAEHVASSAQA